MRHDETVDSIWDDLGCGFEVPWKLRCFAYAVRAVRLTPQERLLKFYGTRAERAAEASQTVSSACFLSFSPNCCKTKSLCSYLFQDCSLEQMEVENEIGKIHNSQVVYFSDLISHRHQKSIKS